jgi:hypothetical protein
MKQLLSLILLLSLLSCSNYIKNKKDLSLELLNSEVHYVDIDSSSLLNSEFKSYEKLVNYTEEQRKNAYNLLTYKIINNSKKKYYLVLNTEDFSFCGNSNFFKNSLKNDSITITSMCYFIDNPSNNKQEVAISTNFFNSKNDSINIYKKKYIEINNNINKDLNFSINKKNYDDYNNQPFFNSILIIHPGQYRVFQKKIYLPIDREKDHNFNLDFNALIIKTEGDKYFSLGFYSNKKFILESLNEYQLKEIQENDSEIFDGLIISNKVPLKIIN